jgi:two-component system sensor histidine kinase KdpD
MVVMVKDRGTTIAESLHEAIFQPYARSDHSGQRGAGLGLALCRAIAQVHGATMAVKARQGGGNSFNFYLTFNPVQPALGAEVAATGDAQEETP